MEGWPVLVALRIPNLAQTEMTLSLSHNQELHTNLTLVQSILKEDGILQVRLKSVMMGSLLHMATHLPDSSWVTLRILAHNKKLEMKIESETPSVKYSTSAMASTTHHQNVNKVSCHGEGCASYIDLKCRYSDSKSNHTEPHKPESITTTSDKKVYYWVFYVVVSLLVLACLLFLTWRNERQKFRMRWWRHSQTVRRMTSLSVQEEDSRQAEGTNETGEWRSGTNLAISNPAYDKRGDSE